MEPSDATRTIPPLLSISTIVRNEALRLPGFLGALAGLDAEVVLVDTGSADDTVAIARAGGCAVHQFPWCDDFSAARNAALSHCQGRWVLSLDADEYIATADHDALMEHLRGPSDRAFRFTTRNYTGETTASGFVFSPPGDPHAGGYPGWFPSTKVRLFPNTPGIAFEGAVHEMIGPSLARRNITLLDSSIPVHHHPLRHRSAAEQRAKQEMYLALGQKKVQADPGNPKGHKELGDQHLDLGQLADALRCYGEAVRLEPENPVWLKDLGAALLLAGRFPQAIQALTISLRIDSGNEECWRNLGIAHARRDEWPDARRAFEEALRLDPGHPETQRYLAIALQACGERTPAIALLEGLLQRFPDHNEARALLQHLRDS